MRQPQPPAPILKLVRSRTLKRVGLRLKNKATHLNNKSLPPFPSPAWDGCRTILHITHAAPKGGINRSIEQVVHVVRLLNNRQSGALGVYTYNRCI